MLKEKYEKWLSKVMKGDNKYIMVTKKDKKWTYLNNGVGEEISYISIVLIKKDKASVFYEWNKDTCKDNKRDFLFIIKDERKLMMVYDEGKYITFGMPDSEDDIDKILITLTADDVNVTISGTKEAKHIDMCYDMVHSEENTLQSCLETVIHQLGDSEHTEREVN